MTKIILALSLLCVSYTAIVDIQLRAAYPYQFTNIYIHPNEAQQEIEIYQRDLNQLIRRRAYINKKINQTEYIAITFKEYLERYDKFYPPGPEYFYRELIFYRNLQKINTFNRNPNRNFDKGINQFVQLQQNQFLASFATLIPQNRIENIVNPPRLLQQVNITQLKNQSVDWTCYVGSVDNQGNCGSCYAFASSDALAAVQTIYAQDKFFNAKFSVQQLISCSDPALQNGCRGGLIELCYDYIIQNGITTALNYPYSSAFSKQPPQCNLSKKNALNKKKITGYRRIPSNCNQVLLNLQQQPLAVGIKSIQLQFYRNGIFMDSSNSISDHAVLLVGYDPEKGWKIKNMWGKSWGILGYAWVNFKQNAGICSRAVAIQDPMIGKQKNDCPIF